MEDKEENELRGMNLRSMAEKAGLEKKFFQQRYLSDVTGEPSPATVNQHWSGRGIGEKARLKYIEIFKSCGIEVTHRDFFETPTKIKKSIKKIPALADVLTQDVLR